MQDFKDKIKNFFTIPKFKEEECTKIFEKVTLFTLTKNKLFLGILFFLLIINILVGFDINQFYIRAILALIFLITIPGLLIMLMLKIRKVGFWEYLVYVVGLSISFIMFGGLTVNWILPWLNITDKPLSLFPILICFNIFLISFWIVAYIRNKDLKPLNITYPKLDLTNRIFFIIPMLFPVLSILGAFLLNNHGTNILTMIMIGGITVYVFLLVIFRKKLNENVFLWALYWMGLALLLSFSLRGNYVIGFDINQEMKVLKLILLNGHWSMNLFQDAYNACLSLSILSPILYFFTNININFIFKLLIQILFSFLPLILYLIYKKIINKSILIFLACFFFISQLFYITQMPTLIRQEIAYLFFSLFFLLLFSEQIKFKKTLLIIFGFSIIVSHYSTSYIFVFSILSTYLVTLFIRKINYFNKNNKNFRLLISITLLIILLVFGFLWTAQITQTSSGLTNSLHNTYTKIDEIFLQESKSEMIQGLLLKKINYKEISQNYSQEVTTNYQNNPKLKLFSPSSPPKYAPPIIKEVKNYKNYKLFYQINFFNSLYFKIMILFGTFVCIIFIKEFKRKDYFIYSTFFLLITLLIAILPYISFCYNFERIFLQSLMFLSIISIYTGYKLFYLISKNENFSMILLTFLLIIFLLSSSLSIPFVFLGGKDISVIFQNEGIEFNKFYTHNSETKSLEWIDSFSKQNNFFYFDRYSKLKVLSILPKFKGEILSDISSSTIDKSSYVFSSFSNIRGTSAVYYGGVSFNLKYPTKFLDNKKNKIYNNGGSEIFK